MKDVIELAKRAAVSDASMLLLGESGTGKELFARSIHQWSHRQSMPFVVINCMALTESLLENELFGHEKGAYTGADSVRKGKIELADEGTIFLDEIGDMPSQLQAKLLRLLQDHEFHRVGGSRLIRVNLRVIAATNRDLAQAVKDGTFRKDLFFRLNVVSLSMPPLRERPEDIQGLVELFLRRHLNEIGKQKMEFTEAALSQLLHYHWPGNIRELDNTIARAVVLGSEKTIGPEQLGLTIEDNAVFPKESGLSYHDALDQYGRYLIDKALRQANGHRTKAAEILQLQRSYFFRLMKQKQISEGLVKGEESENV